MGRVQDYHPCYESKGGAEDNDDPDVWSEMVPRLEQEEDQMGCFQYCKDRNNVTFQVN